MQGVGVNKIIPLFSILLSILVYSYNTDDAKISRMLLSRYWKFETTYIHPGIDRGNEKIDIKKITVRSDLKFLNKSEYTKLSTITVSSKSNDNAAVIIVTERGTWSISNQFFNPSPNEIDTSVISNEAFLQKSDIDDVLKNYTLNTKKSYKINMLGSDQLLVSSLNYESTTWYSM